MEYFLVIAVLLILFAIFDLVVGVSNDAVNFLNASLGSKVAPRHIIMIIASLGMLAGVTFSSGMMEVARKGIFHPEHFYFAELMAIFLAVMLTDIMLLDFFNTFGMPTSTTVSIVFELLGAAVAISLIKIYGNDSGGSLATYINSGQALLIISGILLSIVVAFISGAIVQFFSRLLFTFDYKERLQRYGALWGGMALSSITFFILIKGAKGASFMTPEMLQWMKSNSLILLGIIFVASTILLQLLQMFFNVNILKPVILLGTFALAMSFAANDLVNFIGVPLAGLHSYQAAAASLDPFNMTMGILREPVSSQTYLLLIAGTIMVITLWFSKKASSVSETELSLGRHDEGVEKYDSILLSREIVRMAIRASRIVISIFPKIIMSRIASRFQKKTIIEHEGHSFDLVRASVNLMVASAVVSFATSLKLPLSTTYVTFMVAMGSSFADKAWGRESAVYRVTGVLAVIGGWFFTALMAFTVSSIFAYVVFTFEGWGVATLIIFGAFFIWKNHHIHKRKMQAKSSEDVFNLKKVTDYDYAMKTSFEHSGVLIERIRESLADSFDALYQQDLIRLRKNRKILKEVQRWTNIIIANVFKTLRLFEREHHHDVSTTFAHTIRTLQEIAEGHRDMVVRAYQHIDNNHDGLLPEQIEDIKKLHHILDEQLLTVGEILSNGDFHRNFPLERREEITELFIELDKKQLDRVKNGKSKTRLTILYYCFVSNIDKISKKTLKLLDIYRESFELEK